MKADAEKAKRVAESEKNKAKNCSNKSGIKNLPKRKIFVLAKKLKLKYFNILQWFRLKTVAENQARSGFFRFLLFFFRYAFKNSAFRLLFCDRFQSEQTSKARKILNNDWYIPYLRRRLH